jgi:spermidine synthase
VRSAVAAAPDRRALHALPYLFAASGCAALIYQIVWFEQLGLVIGASAISLGLTLAVFMGGMCIGSLWLPRFVAAARQPLRVYAALELGIGVLGALALIVIPGVGHLYVAASGTADLVLRAVTAAVCLLPATILMGATLPAVARCVEGERNASTWLGACYAANILGGVLGCMLSAFYLLRSYDVYVATAVAVLLNGTVAIVAWQFGTRAPLPPVAAVTPRPSARGAWPIYVAAGFSGFTALSAEVLWTRHLALLIGATVYAFALMLAVFLLGLGAGSGAGAALGARLEPRRALAACQWLLAAAIAWAAYAIARSLPYWPLDVALPTPASVALELDTLRTAFAVLPAALLWGASFPLALAAVAAPATDSRSAVARLYAVNTAGAIVGALVTTFVLVPGLGSQRAQQLAVLLAAAVGVALWLSTRKGRRRAVQAAVAAAVAVALAYSVPALPPELVAYGRFLPTRGVGANVIYVGEGLTASVAVTREPSGVLTYHNAGKTQASTYPQDLRLQRMLGHLSTLVADTPADVLVIGLGAGITAGAVSIDPAVERVVVAEIEPLVPPLAARFFGAHNFGVVASTKVEIRIDDGRHYLATTSRKFDAITSDPLDPWVKGAATLYTREFWQLAKAHLNAGGVVTAFVQLYETDTAAVQSEIATFFGVFPNGALFANRVNGQGYDAVLLGRAGDEPIDVERLAARLGSAAYANVASSLRQVGFESALDLVGTFAGQAGDMAEWLPRAAINTDRNLRLQYLAGAGLNRNGAGEILRALIAPSATFPERLFTGTPAQLEELRQRLAARGSGNQ